MDINKPYISISNEGAELINAWITANQAVDDACRELSRKRSELDNAEIRLGNWMMPANATDGEKFCVYVDDKLLEVEIVSRINKKYRINVRKRENG